MPFVESLSAFFSDFAVAATLDGIAVTGIFDTGNRFGDVGLRGVASVQPTLMLPFDQVAADPVGDTCVVGSVTYKVAAHEHDGVVSTLILERS